MATSTPPSLQLERVVKKSSDRKKMIKMEFPRAKEEHPFREKLRTLG